MTGDDPADRRELSGRDAATLSRVVAGYDCLFIDEAQRIPDIGIVLKLLHDSIPALRKIATGSSSFELAAKSREALTGRSRTFVLHPVAIAELAATRERRDLDCYLPDFMVHGLYTEVLTTEGRAAKRCVLKELAEAYLYKDVLEFGGIRHADRIHDLLRLIAFQGGSEVSIAELATALGLGRDSVGRYIDVLETAIVIFRLRGYSRNLRKEVTKLDKIYFHDVGVRNMVIVNLATGYARRYREAVGEFPRCRMDEYARLSRFFGRNLVLAPSDGSGAGIRRGGGRTASRIRVQVRDQGTQGSPLLVGNLTRFELQYREPRQLARFRAGYRPPAGLLI